MDRNMLPLGLGMAMTEPEKQALIARCRQVKSKREMQQLVNRLTS